MNFRKLLYTSLIHLLFLISFANAQQITDTLNARVDSTELAKFNTDSVRKYFKASDTLIAYQLKKIEDYTISFNKINTQLRRGFSTTFIEKNLPESDSTISIARTNLKGVKGHASLKILYTTKSILLQQQELLFKWQKDLSGFNAELNQIKEDINKAKKDDKLLVMPADSTLFSEYIKKLKPLGEKIELSDSTALLQLNRLGILQNEVSTNYLAVTELLDEADYQISGFADLILENEFGYIWNHQYQSVRTNFKDIVDKSLAESRTLVSYYSRSNWLSRFIVLLIAIGFYFWMFRNIKRIRRQSEAPEAVFGKTKHVARHLILATIVFSLLLIPFIYQEAPQAFTLSLWGLQIIAMAILVRSKLSLLAGLQIFILLMLFYTTGFSNLLIETTYTERWIQFTISTISFGLGLWMQLSNKQNYFSNAGFFKPLLGLFVAMNGLALLLNIFGRVTLAKVLNTGAIYGIIEAINLFIFVEILIDAIYLSMEASKKSSRITAYFKFKGMEMRMRKVLGFFAGLLWVVIFTQNLHIYDAIFGNFGEFLTREINLGDINFTFGSVGVFLLIIWISSLLSQMISFIFGDKDNDEENKNKLGSTILLVRLGIFSLGILLAFAASGIPLDKITIIIGALGVGIGFGLQTIVNNLVSGIILAFEKPVQIGDLIEVGDRTGIVKEVGIRSSILTTVEGSEVIIPNGDMLSQHLINWTKNNNDRRITIDLGVAYGSDINLVEDLIREVLSSHNSVHQVPEPVILIHNFGDNSVDIKVLFWSDMAIWFALKAEIFKTLYIKLNERGINIPFPQRDLHLKSIDPSIDFKFSKPEQNPDAK